MRFPSSLLPATFVKRYKRFFSEAVFDNGTTVTAHCPNTGQMRGLVIPGQRVWLSKSDNPKRKLAYTLELVEVGSSSNLVGINTRWPNLLVAEAIKAKILPELAGYDTIRGEVAYGERSRIDLLLTTPGRKPCYVEVKNAHFCRESGLAEFPDSVTTRGARHLSELSAMVTASNRALMIYVVQRQDCDRFCLARDIDPAYGEAFDLARHVGVESIAYNCQMTLERISLDKLLIFEDGSVS